MKVAVTGTHSVGKTTFISDLSPYIVKTYPTAVFIDEVARRLIKKGFKITPLTEYGIIHYLKEYLISERNSNSEFVLADRSLLDLYSYITVDKSPHIRHGYLELIREIFLLENRFFDFYFYIPIEFPMEQDGARSPNEQYRQAVDQQIVYNMQTNGIRFVTLTGSREKRLETAVNALSLAR